MRAMTFQIVRWLLVASAVAGLGVTLLPAWPTDIWWVRYLDYPRLEFLVVMLITLLLLVLLPGRNRWSWGAAALLVGAIAWDAVLLGPYLLPVATSVVMPTAEVEACQEEKRLRILTVNVQMTNQHDHRLLDIVRKADPDIAWFQETDAWWEDELSPLSATLPHGVAQAQPNYFGVHLFSRFPLENAEVRFLTGSRNTSVFATAVLPSGDRTKLYAIHPRPPQVGQSTAERDGQMMAAALAAREDRVPHIALGDMNAVPWEDVMTRLRDIGGFDDPRIGRGLFITWNAQRTLTKWPLDHILPGEGLRIVDLQVLPAFGSDHLPLLADLCLDGTSVSPPPVEAATLARARESVEKGQGKAIDPGSTVPPNSETGETD